MISVIVPVYKSEETLIRCVKSLQEQTYQELEILLVDDGSPDSCPVLCDRLAEEDGRIRVIHKENGGVSSARNAGLEAAQGEYLVFIDSDDYVEASMLEKLLQGIQRADIAICGFHHHYVGQDVCKNPSVPGNDGAENFLQLYGQGYLNMPWNKLYKRELCGRFDEGLSLGEDLLFNLNYLRRAEGVSVVGEPLYHYIQNETGNTLSSKKREDKLKLGKIIWKAAGDFYRDLTGQEDESGVIDARLFQEVLDDVESLPFDRERSGKEKLAAIREYCADPELKKAGERAALTLPDYRILRFCMQKDWVGLTYVLSVLRSWVVKAQRRLRGKGSV